ncbi:2'-5' RNA ligase family protein [Candidatus Saccharibacteria bacterium]|nr:2'-5' RNA ligase family protein [Candidatus Saccharibacteria bacterium]
MGKDERLYFAYLTENWVVGHAARRSPQHLTLVPPFQLSVTEAIKVCSQTVDEFAPFDVEVLQTDFFGPRQDIEVRLVEPTRKLFNLHESLLRKLGTVGLNTKNLSYVGRDYLPHITVKPSHPNIPQEGQVLRIDHIALMHKDRHFRKLIHKESLHGRQAET